jgi:hypothetical protein
MYTKVNFTRTDLDDLVKSRTKELQGITSAQLDFLRNHHPGPLALDPKEPFDISPHIHDIKIPKMLR